MKSTSTLFYIMVLTVVIAGCTSGNKNAKESEKATIINVKEKVRNEFRYPIPTSFQVTELLERAGAAFVWNITNSVENVEKYETQRDKALNLGIYGADLSYACTYNNNEQAMEVLKASKTLIDGLEISGVFDDNMMERVEQNIGNKDSLILIVTKSFYNTYTELNKAGDHKISFLVVAGSWIESLYITCQLAVSSNYDARILKIVAKQKDVADKLVEMAGKYSDDADVNSIRPLLQFMKIIYEGVDPAVCITKGQLDDISDYVEDTRNEIIN